MRKLIMILTVMALAVAFGAMNASAQTTVAILGNSSQNVTFLNNADGTATIELGSCNVSFTCTLSGGAFNNVGDSGGAYTFTITGDSTCVDCGLLVGGLLGGSSSLHVVIPNGTATSFTLTFADGDTLSGTVNWSSINDDSPNPRFNFVLTGISVSGDAAWTNLFSGSSSVGGDFTLNSMNCGGPVTISPCTLTNLLASSSIDSVALNTASSGELTTPEPGTMMLLGSGLLALGGAIRRRNRKVKA